MIFLHIKPIESQRIPLYFKGFGEKYKEVAPDEFVQKTKNGEVQVSKKSNDLMDALIGGEIITEKEYLMN